MNFNDLYRKIQAIDEGQVVETGTTGTLDSPLMGECGDMMSGPSQSPKQSDSVTMNVSMNGSGAGGIRDLMGILKSIEQGGHDHDHDEVDLAFGEDTPGSDATTTPNPEVAPVSSVIPTGDDLASKGGNEVEKVNGGGNPYTNVGESLTAKLSQMYHEIKEAKEKEPEGLYSSKRHETDGQRIARLAKEKREAEKKERMRNNFNDEMERE